MALTKSVPTDPFLEHLAVEVLARRSAVDTLGTLRGAAAHPTSSVRMIALLAARRLAAPWITNFLSDPDPGLVNAAGRAIHDVPITAGFAQLAQLLMRVDCPSALHSRAIDACFRLGSAQHALLLANFAARTDVPAASRALAVRALADWGQPGPLDRVNGLWRPLVEASAPADQADAAAAANSPRSVLPSPLREKVSVPLPGPISRFDVAANLPPDLGRSATYEQGRAVHRRDTVAKKAFLGKAGELIASGEIEIQAAVISAAVNLRAKEASTPFFEQLSVKTNMPAVRAQLVPALAALNAAQVGAAVRLALDDVDPGVKASAIPYLDRLEGDEAVTRLARFVRSSETESAQAAYAALAKLGNPAADALILAGMETLLAGRLPATLRLDVKLAAAARATSEPRLARHLEQMVLSDRPDEGLAKYRDALAGGSVARGRAIFLENANAQCLRCHQIARNGGTVGPALDGIAKTKSNEYLLESIVFPNKAFAVGFAPPPGAQSAMPEGLGEILSRHELRDLVAYLASLR